MSFMLWQSSGPLRVASPRLVLRAEEVPVLQDAESLRQRMLTMHGEANRRLDAALAEAREQGLAEGREAGMQAVREELAKGLETLARQSAAERERLRGEIAALSLQVVRKLLGEFGEADKLVALAVSAAREALPAAPQRLVVAPAMLESVRERLAAARQRDADAPFAHCEVVADGTLSPGQCRLDTQWGSVDASLESQLDRLAAVWGVHLDTGVTLAKPA
jgi:type III secretion protein L